MELELENKFRKLIKPYCLVEICYDQEFIKICNDECEIVDGKLYLNEDPADDVELEEISRIWYFNDTTNGFDLVWDRRQEQKEDKIANNRIKYLLNKENCCPLDKDELHELQELVNKYGYPDCK